MGFETRSENTGSTGINTEDGATITEGISVSGSSLPSDGSTGTYSEDFTSGPTYNPTGSMEISTFETGSVNTGSTGTNTEDGATITEGISVSGSSLPFDGSTGTYSENLTSGPTYNPTGSMEISTFVTRSE